MRHTAHLRRDQITDWLGDTELKAKPEPGYRHEHNERNWLSEFADEPGAGPTELANVTPPERGVFGDISYAADRLVPVEAARLRTIPRPVAIAIPVVMLLALAVGIVVKNVSFRQADAPGSVLQAAISAEAEPIATATSAQPASPPEAPAPRVTPPPKTPQIRSTSPKGAPIVAPVVPDKKRNAALKEPQRSSVSENALASRPVVSAPVPAPQTPPTQNASTSLGSVLKTVPPAAIAVTPPPPPAADRRVETPADRRVDAPADRRAEAPVPRATPLPRATPAPSAREMETAAVQSVLERYRASFNSLSVAGVQNFWPGANTRTLSKAFEQLQSQQLDFDSCGIDVYLLTGTATARCRGRATFVPRVGGRSERSEQRAWSFALSRVDDRWIIVSVESR